jgi:chromosomal replication initiator protein
MFISAERFMYHFIRSIKNNDMVKFKDFFRRVDVLSLMTFSL